MSMIDPADPLKPLLDRARLNALLTDIRDMIEQSGATEVYFIVAVPQGANTVKMVCADTGTQRYGKQAVEIFNSYIKEKS